MRRAKIATEEHIAYIRGIAEGLHTREITEKFNEHFGTAYTVSQIMHVKKKAKICSHKFGSDSTGGRFEKGHQSDHKLPLGAVGLRHHPRGNHYWWIKIAEPNVWIQYSKWLWTNAYGEVPKGHVLYYLDGDSSHCCLRNIVCIHRNILCLMNHIEKSDNAEVNRVRIAELELAKAMVARGAKNVIKYKD